MALLIDNDCTPRDACLEVSLEVSHCQRGMRLLDFA